MDISLDKVQEFREKHGKRAANVLSCLGKSQTFINAIESDLGQELLKDIGNKLEELFHKIVDEKATPQDLAEFRAYKAIGVLWAGKIAQHQKLRQEIIK